VYSWSVLKNGTKTAAATKGVDKALLDKFTLTLAKKIAKKNGESTTQVLERMLQAATQSARSTKRSTFNPRIGAHTSATSRV